MTVFVSSHGHCLLNKWTALW